MPINYTLDRMSIFRRWLFEKGTRGIEFLNALLLISFSLVAAINFFDLLNLPSYFRFNLTNWWHWLFVLVLGILQIVAMCCRSNRSNQASGLVLMFSGCVWLFIAAIFSVNQLGVFTTAVTTYTIIALFTMMAGYELLTINKIIEKNNAKTKGQ